MAAVRCVTCNCYDLIDGKCIGCKKTQEQCVCAPCPNNGGHMLANQQANNRT